MTRRVSKMLWSLVSKRSRRWTKERLFTI